MSAKKHQSSSSKKKEKKVFQKISSNIAGGIYFCQHQTGECGPFARQRECSNSGGVDGDLSTEAYSLGRSQTDIMVRGRATAGVPRQTRGRNGSESPGNGP